jgi:glycerol uptake facilitator-like aquaporin
MNLKTNNMKKEKQHFGFIIGFFIGGILGIIIHDLVIKGIL